MTATAFQFVDAPTFTRSEIPTQPSLPMDDVGFRLREARWNHVRSYGDGDADQVNRTRWNLDRTQAQVAADGFSSEQIRAMLHPDIIPDTQRERSILPTAVVTAWDEVTSALKSTGSQRRAVLVGLAVGGRYDIALDRAPQHPGDCYLEIERMGPAWDQTRLRVRAIAEQPHRPHQYVSHAFGFNDPYLGAWAFVGALSQRNQL